MHTAQNHQPTLTIITVANTQPLPLSFTARRCPTHFLSALAHNTSHQSTLIHIHVHSMIGLAILTQYCNVTNRQTDRRNCYTKMAFRTTSHVDK